VPVKVVLPEEPLVRVVLVIVVVSEAAHDGLLSSQIAADALTTAS